MVICILSQIRRSKKFELVNSNFLDNNGYGDIPIPTRDGYIFKGWYRSKSPTATSSPFTDFTPILSDLELFAIWEKIA